MAYQLTFEAKPGYLHARVTGENTIENVKGYIAEIRRECAARGCAYLLVEERLEGPRFGVTKVYEIVSEGSARARGAFEAIAYVDVNTDGKLVGFAENVATNRGVPIRIFMTVAEAEEWLRQQVRGEPPKPAQ
jgi:hypothetical protein